ncbi:hypothetical protein BDZ91DRAFT_709559 [Kalaharituber pfeilii]|nr:hypothetical protein BDZ91DRAFT_709559 [Kalaharituber pfeilii]
MTVTVFVTGASGYIGGTVLNTLATEKHPEFSYRALVRSESFAEKIRSKYTNVTPVVGSLDDLNLIEEESSKADIVVNTANVDHTASPPALLRGLSRPLPNDTTPPKNRYLIHTSGTSVLNDDAFGTRLNTHIYDDYKATSELVHGLPDTAWHRDAEKLALFNDEAPRAKNVHAAIICPPCIYGRGTGPGKVVSWQLPQMIKYFIKRGKGFTVNDGEALWGNVHVLDLAELYACLFEKAVAAPNGQPEEGIWDNDGYFLAATGEHHWGETMKLMAQALHQRGHLSTAETDKLTPSEIKALGSPHGDQEWGCNSRGIAEHGKQKLGWKPQRGNPEQPVGDWRTGRPKGLGRKELEEEINFYEEGLIV